MGKEFSISQRIGGLMMIFRSNNNQTLQQLSTNLGYSVVTLSKMESGRHDFKLSQIERISAYYDCPVSKLIEGSIPENKE